MASKVNVLCDNLKVREKLLLCGTVEPRAPATKVTVGSDLVVQGSIELDGPILPESKTINVPSAGFPTIQSAINWFTNKHAVGVIKVAAGQYVESLNIDKISSSRVKDNLYHDGLGGFSIVGDTRPIVGIAFINGGHNLNFYDPFVSVPFPGIGDFYDGDFNPAANVITLVGGTNTISVTGCNTDFYVAGVVQGDKIKIRKNGPNAEWELRTVSSVSGNTITYSGVSVADVGGYMSALIVCPNVEILPSVAYSSGAIHINNATVNMRGLWINSDQARGAAGLQLNLIYASYSNLNLTNCILDDSSFSLGGGVVFLDSGCSLSNKRSDEIEIYYVSNSYIGGPGYGVGFRNNTIFEAFVQSIFDSGSFGIQTENNTSMFLYYGHIMNSGIYSVLMDTGTYYMELNKMFSFGRAAVSTQASDGVFVDNLIDASFDGVTLNTRGRCLRLVHASVNTGGNVYLNANLSILARSTSNVNDSGSDYSACTRGVVLESNSVFNDLSLNPKNSLIYTASGEMNNSLFNQTLDAVSPLALTLNPSLALTYPGGASAPDRIKIYQGKQYTIRSATAVAHTLTLSGGATFVGSGASGTIATWDGAANDFLSFLVLSDTNVFVTAKSGITFS